MANKMSFEKFQEYVIAKNPNARVWIKDNKVNIDFNKNDSYSKFYEYGKTSYVQILQKLGYTIEYEYVIQNVRAEIKRLETEIADGGYEDIFGFSEGFVKHSEEQLQNMRHELEHQKNRLNDRNLIII